MAASSSFESLPPEIRNMIYVYLLPPAQLEKKLSLSAYRRPQYLACVLPKGNTAILRTNRNINQEASAVLYSDILLVSIDWNTNDRAYLQFDMVPSHVTFTFVQPGAPLPPCLVHIQQKYHHGKNTAARISTIIAAADFPAICRRLLDPWFNYMDAARTSYSVLSLPKMGYNVDKLRELIWSPLLAIREGRLGNHGGRNHPSLRLIDCTGVFEQKAAKLNWDSDLDDGDDTDQEGESHERYSDDDGRETDTSGEDYDDDKEVGENIDMEDSDEGASDDEDSDEAKSIENSNEDGSIDEENGNTDDEEYTSAETTTNENQSKDPEEMISNSVSSTLGRNGDANAHIVVKTTAWLEAGLMINLIVRCLLILRQMGMSMDNGQGGMPRSNDPGYAPLVTLFVTLSTVS